MTNPRIYLAGPDVFAVDAPARFDLLRQLCHQRGLDGLEPSDGNMKTQPGPGHEVAKRIYVDNIALIESSHGVLANLESFRGLEPDSGTVFEVGFSVARGLPVACVLPNAASTYAERVAQTCGLSECGFYDASQGWLVENFGLPHNLMLAVPCRIFASVEEALDWLAVATRAP